MKLGDVQTPNVRPLTRTGLIIIAFIAAAGILLILTGLPHLHVLALCSFLITGVVYHVTRDPRAFRLLLMNAAILVSWLMLRELFADLSPYPAGIAALARFCTGNLFVQIWLVLATLGGMSVGLSTHLKPHERPSGRE